MNYIILAGMLWIIWKGLIQKPRQKKKTSKSAKEQPLDLSRLNPDTKKAILKLIQKNR